MRSISGRIGVARTSDGVLHIVWSRGGAGTAWALFDTAVTPAGNVAAPKVIASGWSRIDDPAVVAHGRALTVVFPGVKTDKTGDPTDGLDSATNSGGGWSVRAAAIDASDFAGSPVPALAQTTDAKLVQAWPANGQVAVQSGLDPAATVQRGFGKGDNVALAGSDSVWVGWCGTQPGIFVRAVNPGSAAPTGPTLRMPGSQTTRCPAATRVQLVARAGGGAFAAASVSSERAVLVWKVGSSAATTVAGDSGIKQQIALAADPDGRLWVGWRDTSSGQLLFRRSNRTATEWGAVVSTSVPASQDGVYNLDLAGQSDRVDAIARTARSSSGVSLLHTQIFPGLTVSATGTSGHATVVVTDAGDPVAGSTVHVGTHLLRTTGDGTAGLDLAPGSYAVSATKADYVGASTHVSVKPPKQ
jgi:hypothetical protein